MVKLVMLETLYQMLELHTTPAARRKFVTGVFSFIVMVFVHVFSARHFCIQLFVYFSTLRFFLKNLL